MLLGCHSDVIDIFLSTFCTHKSSPGMLMHVRAYLIDASALVSKQNKSIGLKVGKIRTSTL